MLGAEDGEEGGAEGSLDWGTLTGDRDGVTGAGCGILLDKVFEIWSRVLEAVLRIADG